MADSKDLIINKLKEENKNLKDEVELLAGEIEQRDEIIHNRIYGDENYRLNYKEYLDKVLVKDIILIEKFLDILKTEERIRKNIIKYQIDNDEDSKNYSDDILFELKMNKYYLSKILDEKMHTFDKISNNIFTENI